VICVLLSWVGTELLLSFLNCYSVVSVEGRELILTGISSSWLSADSVEVVGRSCGGYSLSEQSCSGYRFFFFEGFGAV
jgi:hypothetical protein